MKKITTLLLLGIVILLFNNSSLYAIELECIPVVKINDSTGEKLYYTKKEEKLFPINIIIGLENKVYLSALGEKETFNLQSNSGEGNVYFSQKNLYLIQLKSKPRIWMLKMRKSGINYTLGYDCSRI